MKLRLLSPRSLWLVLLTIGLLAPGFIRQVLAQGAFATLYTFSAGTAGTNPGGKLAKGSDGTLYGTTFSGGPADQGTIYKISPAGVRTTLYFFGGNRDEDPEGVVLGQDGNLYGILSSGGTFGQGAFYRVTPAGVFTLLRSFYSDVDGATPSALFVGADGNFYGTCRFGGTDGSGTVFKVVTTGVLTVLYYFGEHDTTVTGRSPETGLAAGTDGAFYGITTSGGLNSAGTFFKITAGGVFTKLSDFDPAALNRPDQPLVLGSDSNFYSVNETGGANSEGAVLRLSPGGVIISLHEFNSATESYYPGSALVESGGEFYGTTQYGGTNSQGSIFKVTTLGVFTTVSNFGYDPNEYGYAPATPLLVGNDGRFYAAYSKGILASTTAGVVSAFSGLGTNIEPYYPAGNLARGTDGAIYGTTISGGTNNAGAVFKISPSGIFSVLSSFDYVLTGAYPRSGLILGADGNFYGTCTQGFYNNATQVYDNGTLFKVTPAGVISVVHSFADAENVTADNAIMQAADGNFYGTTTSGGSNGDGVVYKVAANGAFTKLYDFQANLSGSQPSWKLVQGSDGALYGVTSNGTTYNQGGVFKIGTDGTNFTVLHRFNAYTEGTNPSGVSISGGNLIRGTLRSSGPGENGLVYQITTSGVFTALHAFSGGSDGGSPFGFPTEAAGGVFYGNTERGGANNNGVIYQLTASGAFSIVGSHPAALSENNYHLELVQGTDGLLYGASSYDGANRVGNIYRFNPVPYVAPPPPPPPAPAIVLYTVTAVARPATKGTVTGSGSYAAGSTITLRARPKPGKTFLGWKENGKIIGRKLVLTLNIQSSRYLVATFQ